MDSTFSSTLLPSDSQWTAAMAILRGTALPSNATTTHFRSVIVAAPAELENYDAAISHKKQQMAQLAKDCDILLKERMRLEKYVSACRNAFAPVRRLPPEILLRIFEIVAQLRTTRNQYTDWDDNLKKRHLSAAAGVCSHWRKLILGTSSLWCSIDADLRHCSDSRRMAKRLLRRALKLSQKSPWLDFTLKLEEIDDTSAIDTLTEEAERWRSVTLSVSGGVSPLAGLWDGEARFDKLQSICLFNDRSLEQLTVLEFAPMLVRVAFSSVPPKLPWMQLSEVSFQTLENEPISSGTTLLERIKFLELCAPHCAVSMPWLRLEDLRDWTKQLPPRPSLRSNVARLRLGLSLKKGQTRRILGNLLARLEFANLSELHIHPGKPEEHKDVEPLWWSRNAFLRFADHTQLHKLSSLLLHNVRIEHEELIDVLTSTPALEKLFVQDIAAYSEWDVRSQRVVYLGRHTLITNSLLDALSPINSESNDVVAPRLVEFGFASEMEPEIVSDDSIRSMLSSRVDHLRQTPGVLRPVFTFRITVLLRRTTESYRYPKSDEAAFNAKHERLRGLLQPLDSDDREMVVFSVVPQVDLETEYLQGANPDAPKKIKRIIISAETMAQRFVRDEEEELDLVSRHMGWLQAFTGLVAFVVLAALYVWRNDRCLVQLPPEAEFVSPHRTTAEDVRNTSARLLASPISIADQIPPRTGRRNDLVDDFLPFSSWVLLERGEDPRRIRVLDIRLPSRPDLKTGKVVDVQFMQVDISDRAAVDAAFHAPWPDSDASPQPETTVFHTAANIRFFEKSEALMPASARVNIQGTQNIIDAARAIGASAMVYTSSGSVSVRRTRFLLWPWENEPRFFIQPIDEDEGIIPKQHDQFFSNYAASKIQAERRVREADGSKSGKGVLRTGSLRPGNGIYGPGGDMLCGAYLVRKVNPTWCNSIIQNFVYVENGALAHLLYEERLIELANGSTNPDIGGKAFVVADPGRPPTYGDVYLTLTTLMDGETVFPMMSPTLMILISHLIEWYYLLSKSSFLAKYLPPVSGDIVNLQPSLFNLVSVNLVFDDSRARLPPEKGGLGYKGGWTTMEGLHKTVEEHKKGGLASHQRSDVAGISLGFGLGKAQRGVAKVNEKVKEKVGVDPAMVLGSTK
ncbi:3-beta hydroxysteroid dehydrogenase isomerase family [Mycena chlorophos]|uniref:3-beta hydroxysteroid dehydrogenase isomerase family n=1 Tax=Mycena chlorophos TaxID=658473 RepID=A0A8H6W2I5_MYCCL|nr:3-beta hydroxysteroid dehydrogenase isomerase family [Mycena chlorophos]